MATNGCCPVAFCYTHENAFYFEVAEKDLEEDKFGISDQICKHLIQNNDDKFLLLNDDGQFQAQQLTAQQQCKPECIFNIQIYKGSPIGSSERAVMLYANKNGKKMVVCCNESYEIYPEAMDPPREITESAHKAMFYLRSLSNQTNIFMFRSSLYPNQFLGFEPREDNTSLNKLVLRQKAEDEVDEFCEITLTKPS